MKIMIIILNHNSYMFQHVCIKFYTQKNAGIITPTAKKLVIQKVDIYGALFLESIIKSGIFIEKIYL